MGPQTGTDTSAAPVTVTVHASGDSYQGAPDMQVFVDGQQIGEVTVAEQHKADQWQDYTFTTSAVTDPHSVEVTFVNDLYGGSPATDRNLWVDSIDVNGQHFLPEDGVYHGGRWDGQAGQALLRWNGGLVVDTNGAPQVVDDTASTKMNTPVAVAVLANDSDPNHCTLTHTPTTDYLWS